MFWWFRWVLRLSLVGFIPTTPAQWHQANRQESSQQLPFHPASAGRLWQQGWRQDAANRHVLRMLRAVTLGPPSVRRVARHLVPSQLWTQIFWGDGSLTTRKWAAKRDVVDYNGDITLVLYEYWSFVCKFNSFKPANLPGSGACGSPTRTYCIQNLPSQTCGMVHHDPWKPNPTDLQAHGVVSMWVTVVPCIFCVQEMANHHVRLLKCLDWFSFVATHESTHQPLSRVSINRLYIQIYRNTYIFVTLPLQKAKVLKMLQIQIHFNPLILSYINPSTICELASNSSPKKSVLHRGRKEWRTPSRPLVQPPAESHLFQPWVWNQKLPIRKT